MDLEQVIKWHNSLIVSWDLIKSKSSHINTDPNSIFLFYPITLGGRRGTTDEFATIPFHLDLFSAALVELAKSVPVHSLVLSSHRFFCLPLFLFPFTVPCRIVFAKPEDLETWPNHLSFCFLTRVKPYVKYQNPSSGGYQDIVLTRFFYCYKWQNGKGP